MFKIVVLSALVGLSMANKFNFINKCSHTVWVATQGNPNKGNPENGGFQLNAGQTHSFNTVRGWAGRMWGKTGCQVSRHASILTTLIFIFVSFLFNVIL